MKVLRVDIAEEEDLNDFLLSIAECFPHILGLEGVLLVDS